MKKLVLILVVMMMSAPAMAEIVITIDNSVYPAEVKYETTGLTVLPRAFALDIKTDGTEDVNGMTDLSTDYWVHPGGINIVGGEVEQEGNAWADPCDYPGGTEGGIDTTGVTIEMASLYVGEFNAPDPCGTLCSFTVTGQCLVSITENTIRGGVVKEDTNSATPDMNLAGATDIQVPFNPECYTGPDVVEWRSLGSPISWCGPRQCHGDADGIELGNPKLGYTRINTGDLNLLIQCWDCNTADVLAAPPLLGVDIIAADVDHKELGNPKQGYTRLNTGDLNIITLFYWDANSAEVPADCLTANPVVP